MTLNIDSTEQTASKLIDIHGEGGLSPTKEDWKVILRLPADQPVNILNLLKFELEVQSLEGLVSGLEAYGKYSESVGAAFARNGGKRIFFGKVNHLFGNVPGTDWDAAIVTEYPTPIALANFWLDEEFIAGHKHRNDGVEKSRVLVMNSR